MRTRSWLCTNPGARSLGGLWKRAKSPALGLWRWSQVPLQGQTCWGARAALTGRERAALLSLCDPCSVAAAISCTALAPSSEWLWKSPTPLASPGFQGQAFPTRPGRKEGAGLCWGGKCHLAAPGSSGTPPLSRETPCWSLRRAPKSGVASAPLGSRQRRSFFHLPSQGPAAALPLHSSPIAVEGDHRRLLPEEPRRRDRPRPF